MSIVLGFANRVSAACASFPTDKGTVTSTVTAATSGTYYIWSRNRSTASGSNGYYLQIDNSTSNCFTVGDTNIPVNSWTWVNYQNGSTSNRMSVNLSSGSHTFKLYGLDANLQVDKVLFTTDSACTPSGTGDNCSNSTTDPPPIVISNPNNPTTTPTYNGTITVGSGNNKTIVKVDGTAIASGNGQVSLDTSQLSDGYHTLAIESIDANGNKTTTYRKILVQNHHNFVTRFYHSLYMGLGKNSVLAMMIMGLVGILLLVFIGLGLYLAWFFKVWEKIPSVNRIHLKFLHVPGFMYRLGAKFPDLGFPFMNSPTQPSANGVVISGTQTIHSGTMQGNVFQRFFGHPGSRWFMVLGFALIGTITALYSLAATTAFIVEPENGSLSTAIKVNDGSASGGSYILFGTGSCPAGQTGTPPNCTTPPPSTCPAGQTGTPPNCVTPPPPTNTTIPYNATVCTGRDSAGGVPNGFWPGAACTGVPAGVTLTNYTGPLTITAAGTTIDAKRINGCITIQAVNVTIKRSKITGCVGNHSAVVKSSANNNNTLVEDVEIDGGSNPANADLSAVGYTGLTCRRCNLYNLDKGGHFDGENFTMEYSWIHDLYMPFGADGSDHGDGIYSDYSRNGLIKRNNIDAIDHAPAQDNNSGAMAMYNLYGGHDNTVIENNLFNTDSTICLYVGYTHTAEYDTTRLRVIDNRFGQKYFPTCASWLPVWSAGAKKPMNWGSSNGNVWSGNTYTNGTVVGPPT